MGGRRLATPQSDNAAKNPRGNRYNNGQQGGNGQNGQRPKQNNTVLANTQTRRGEVFRAQRRTSDDVNAQASQHIVGIR